MSPIFFAPRGLLLLALGNLRAAATTECFVTSEDLTLTLSACDAPALGSIASPDWKLYVDDSAAGVRQEVTGFGASWTDTTVAMFETLSSEQQTQLMDDLFGESGIKLRLMRTTIGQSDLTPSSVGQWSFDDNGGQPDANLTAWALTEPGEKMLQWVARMRAYSDDITLLGSPWSPPAWMKQNNNLRWEYVDSWVAYMVEYLRTYEAAGVRVDAITLQNEPLHDADAAWSMYMDASYQAILVNLLGPAIAQAGLSTELWAYDHNTDVPEYPQYVLDNAGEYVDTVAWHCYGGGWTPMATFRDANPGVKQYMTECWLHLDSGEGFFDLPGFMTGPLQNGCSGSLAWTLGGSTAYDAAYPGGCEQCSGIIQVNEAIGAYVKTQDYYSLGQFSKFVDVGASYLDGSGSYDYADGTGVQMTAFRNVDGGRVVVIENKISNDLHMQVAFGGDTWNGVVAGRSLTTWVLPSGTTN